MASNKQELGDLINDDEKALDRIYQAAQRSEKLIELLNRALPSVYKQVAAGKEKYGGDDPDLGSFQLAPSQREESSCLDLVYLPSESQRMAAELVVGAPDEIDEAKIGELNLNNKHYRLYDSAAEVLEEVPKEVIEDTRLAMAELGLKERKEDELSEIAPEKRE